jgi:hypothetical protein
MTHMDKPPQWRTIADLRGWERDSRVLIRSDLRNDAAIVVPSISVFLMSSAFDKLSGRNSFPQSLRRDPPTSITGAACCLTSLLTHPSR